MRMTRKQLEAFFRETAWSDVKDAVGGSIELAMRQLSNVGCEERYADVLRGRIAACRDFLELEETLPDECDREVETKEDTDA